MGAWRAALASVCAALGLGFAQAGVAEPVALACQGRAIHYTEDLTRQLETRDPFQFDVIFDVAGRRLLSAPAQDLETLVLRDAGDSIFFFRNRLIGERAVLEWISISRMTGNYAHFIAFRDDDPPGVRSPLLMATGDCKRAN